jgi:glucose-6-phosphate isomerase
MQQLYDGPDDCFVVFVAVDVDDVPLHDDVTPTDYAFASLEATRDALYERGRQSMTIRLERITPRSIGALIALFERAVGIYAELIDVNAYDQPAVNKRVAEDIADLQRSVVTLLKDAAQPLTAAQIASAIGQEARVETIYKLMEHLAADRRRRIVRSPGAVSFEERFSLE